MGSDLRLERDGPVLIVTIDRADHMNSLGIQMHEDLSSTRNGGRPAAERAAWQGLGSGPGARANVITGVGKRTFCTGMDPKELASSGRYRGTSDNVVQTKAWFVRPMLGRRAVVCMQEVLRQGLSRPDGGAMANRRDETLKGLGQGA